MDVDYGSVYGIDFEGGDDVAIDRGAPPPAPPGDGGPGDIVSLYVHRPGFGQGCLFLAHGEVKPRDNHELGLQTVLNLPRETRNQPKHNNGDGDIFLRFWTTVQATTNHALTNVLTTINAKVTFGDLPGFPPEGCEYVMPRGSSYSSASAIVSQIRAELVPPDPYYDLTDVMTVTHPNGSGFYKRWPRFNRATAPIFAEALARCAASRMLVNERISGSSSLASVNTYVQDENVAWYMDALIRFWKPQHRIGFVDEERPRHPDWLLHRD